MIKPTYLWALCKTCSDSKWIGDICRFLGGQNVALDFGQKQVADMIKMDSEWMDERINWNREAARMRQAKARERRAANAENASREVTPVTRDNGASREVTPASRQSIHPSVHPSIHPSTNNIYPDSDSESDKTPLPPVGERPPESESESGKISDGLKKLGKLKHNPWTMSADEIRYGDLPAPAMLRLAFGNGGWRKAIDQAGEDAVRELFLQFRAEMRAGEIPDNAASAFTEQLRRKLGVDWNKPTTHK